MREVAVGDKLDQYEITKLIARSGMASIFEAKDTASGTAVALKVPHLQFESDVVFFERFQREEEIGQRLDHPNIIKFLKPRHKSRMYVAMELVAGKSLRKLMEAGLVKIIDLGIALDKSARRITWFGLSATIGTPDYIAPEQIGGRRGDARTDIYALGTILYEMLTGNLPFSGPNALAVMRAKTDEEPRLPSYFVPGFDPSLEAIVLKAIERNPRDRYQTASEFLHDLRNPSAVPPRDPLAGSGRRRRRGGIPRRLAMSLLVAAIVAALASLVWASSRHPPPRRPPATVRER